MAKSKNYHTYEELVELLKKSGRAYNFDIIAKAYKFAKEAHKFQKRVSGVEYILHPISVAYILGELGMETACVAAALLHDVVEDTSVTKEKIISLFGDEIGNLVDGVTKIKKISPKTREEQQAEDVSKMLLAMLQDIRVIMIKLADRLHNMRTIDCMPTHKKIEKSLQNMEVFAPIAHRLGIRTIKDELEDKSLQYLDPVGYSEVVNALSLCTEDAKKFIENIKELLVERIKPLIPAVYVEGRVKSNNEIYKKMFIKGRSIEEIYDIYAVRVIVNKVEECYNVFGIAHDMFQPIPRRFKDYISMPKQNMYQSLHTTVMSDLGIPFEIQIRTWEMHRTAEYGIAAHWKYKLDALSGSSKFSNVSWIRKLLDNHRDSNDMQDLVGNIKSDLATKEIFVLTPRGNVVKLPVGSTVIDFAYAIHTELGHHLVGAKVNQKMVSITHELKTGEIVEVISSKNTAKGPARDWMNFAKTTEARGKIKQWFRRECRDENIEKGKAEVESEFRKNGIELSGKSLEEFLKPMISKHHCSTIEDFYAAVGYGGIHLWKLIPHFRCEFNSKIKNEKESLKCQIKNLDAKEKHSDKKSKFEDRMTHSNNIIIDSVDGCAVRLAKCCNPLPEDMIAGFVTKGCGITVHKLGCPNLSRNANADGKIVSAEWASEINQIFDTTIEIKTKLSEKTINKLTQKIFAINNLRFRSLSSNSLPNMKTTLHFKIGVENVKQLNQILSEILNLSGVESARVVSES